MPMNNAANRLENANKKIGNENYQVEAEDLQWLMGREKRNKERDVGNGVQIYDVVYNTQ